MTQELDQGGKRVDLLRHTVAPRCQRFFGFFGFLFWDLDLGCHRCRIKGCQRITDWKLVSDGLYDVLQFIFTTTKGAFFGPAGIARSNAAYPIKCSGVHTAMPNR
jgi:hypothetical protein